MKSKFEALKPKWRRNIRRVYLSASPEHIREGLNWYQRAHEECAQVGEGLGVDVQQVAGVVAALSPSLPWERNISEAQRFIATFQRYGAEYVVREPYGVYGQRNRIKCVRILEGTFPELVLGGPKTCAFFWNIFRPLLDDSVTIDGHAANAAYNEVRPIEQRRVEGTNYVHLANAYREVAREVGILGHQIQAIVWISWRSNL